MMNASLLSVLPSMLLPGVVVRSGSHIGKVSVDRQPTHPPPGRIVTLGVHTVMRPLLSSRLFRAHRLAASTDGAAD